MPKVTRGRKGTRQSSSGDGGAGRGARAPGLVFPPFPEFALPETVIEGTEMPATAPLQDRGDTQHTGGEITAGTGESVSDDELPVLPGGLGRKMDAHLDEKLIQKVARGRDVHLNTLLPSYRAVNRMAYDAGSGTVTPVPAERKLYRFEEWLYAFLVYAAVRLESHREESPGLFKYIQTVKRINDRGGNFVRYDETFRSLRRGKLELIGMKQIERSLDGRWVIRAMFLLRGTRLRRECQPEGQLTDVLPLHLSPGLNLTVGHLISLASVVGPAANIVMHALSVGESIRLVPVVSSKVRK